LGVSKGRAEQRRGDTDVYVAPLSS
jgi:hypothetical protein